MSEKLRNENLGESQRDIQKDIQKDVQSPSVSSFDQKKEFFENVLATKEEEVPMKEVQTEQKKEINEDLQTIGQNQKGKTFEEKKEFFENIGTDKDEKVEEPPCPSDSQQKISPTEEWRNKYEGESQNLIGSESSDLECKERSSQKNIESNKDEKVSSYGSGSTTSFQQVKDSQLQSQDLSSKSQQERKDDSSFSTESPMQQGKDTSFGSTIPSSGSESSLKGKDTSFQQQKDTSLQSQDLSNKSQQERKDDSSFSTGSPMQLVKDTSFGSTIPSSGSESSLKGKDTSLQQQKDTSLQSQDLSNKSQQERKDDSSFSTESPMQQGKDTSFGSTIPSSGSESSLKGKDDTAFGSFFPKEGQTTQQGDLINFGQQNEYEKQGQESSFLGSVSSTLPQEVRSGETKQNKKDCCEHEDCNCKVGECDCNEKKDKDIKSRRRKKGFEPKDPSQFTDVPKQSYQPNDKDLI